MLPNSLAEAISAARAAVDSDSQHDLPLGHRHRVWQALGQHSAVRVYLAAFVARRVHPLWTARWPDRDLPARIMSEAGEILRGVRQYDSSRYFAYKKVLLGLPETSQQQIEVASGFSALAAMYVAGHDELFPDVPAKLTVVDADLDPDYWSAAAFAAIAAAGGPVNSPAADNNRRRAFWHWWLNEGLALAWKHGQGKSGPRRLAPMANAQPPRVEFDEQHHPEKIIALGQRIGYLPNPHPIFDLTFDPRYRRHQRYYLASCAAKKTLLTLLSHRSDDPTGPLMISQSDPLCADCRMFLSQAAIHFQRNVIVVTGGADDICQSGANVFTTDGALNVIPEEVLDRVLKQGS